MKNLIITILFGSSILSAQDVEFNVSVSNDTLLLGNYLEVRFEIMNGTGSFEAPDFSGWNIVAGPNSASSYSIMNGIVSQSSSYTYYLEAPTEGQFFIDAAKLKTTGKELKTPSLSIIVLPNPEGIRQHPENINENRLFPEERLLETPAKKKRKPTKI